VSVIEDLPERYRDYLERCTRELGDIKVGAFAKFGGRLIKKMSFEEFTPAFLEFEEMTEQYQESMERGDTINDLVLKLLREQAATLLLKPPA
jgi:hypothetical protein